LLHRLSVSQKAKISRFPDLIKHLIMHIELKD